MSTSTPLRPASSAPTSARAPIGERVADAPQPTAAADAPRTSRSTAVLALHARVLAHEHFDTAAAEFVNQLALLLPCERVSLGLRVGSRLKLMAVSGGAEVVRGQGAVQRLENAMTEAFDQRAPIVFPLPSAATPAVTVAHRALVQGSGAPGQGSGRCVFTVPITTRHEMLGAVLFERDESFDRRSCETARDAVMFVAPLLALEQRLENTPGRRLGRALGQGTRSGAIFGARGLPLARLAAVVAMLAVALIALVPLQHRVVASARVEGSVQQIIAAPFDGFVGSVAVRPGDVVTRGQVLATLDAREATLDRDKWAAEVAQLDKQFREALARDDAAPIVTARAKLDAARSRHEFALQQIERATLRAPIDGIVLSGDLSQAIGTPLQRGQELLALAPDRDWRIVAEVDERDVDEVRQGARAQALFAAIGDREPPTFTVARIAPTAVQLDGRNVFEVEGTPASVGSATRTDRALRPGMRGVVRIDVGTQPLLTTWAAKLAHAWRHLTWQLLG